MLVYSYSCINVVKSGNETRISFQITFNLENNTWSYVERHPSKAPIKSKWVFKVVDSAHEGAPKFKARLCAKGFLQQEGVDYTETFAPVVRYDSLRMLLALVAQKDPEITTFDVRTAFLYGSLQEEIDMEIPLGLDFNGQFKDSTKMGSHARLMTSAINNYVCRLNKSLYGLKQAPRCWNQRFKHFLSKFRLTESDADKCMFVGQKYTSTNNNNTNINFLSTLKTKIMRTSFSDTMKPTKFSKNEHYSDICCDGRYESHRTTMIVRHIGSTTRDIHTRKHTLTNMYTHEARRRQTKWQQWQHRHRTRTAWNVDGKLVAATKLGRKTKSRSLSISLRYACACDHRSGPMPVQPATGQSYRFVQTCRLPSLPRRRRPSSRGSTETSTPKRPACDNNKVPDKTKIEILAEDSDVLSEKLPKLKSKPKQNKTRINTNTKIVNSEPSQLATQNDYDAVHTLNKLIQEKLVRNDSLSTCDKNKSKNKKLENNQSKSTASDNTVPQLVKKKSKNKTLKKRKEKTSCKQTSTVDTSTSTVNDENVTVAHDSSHRISPTDYDTREIEIIPAAPIRIGDPRFYVKVDILGEKFDMLFDHGAVSSWFGEKPAKLLEKYIKPSSTYLEGPTGDLCQNEGKVDINITIDDITLNTTFRVNKALQYEVLLGIDLQKKFNITICAGEEKWHTPANIMHYFKPNDKEVTCSLEAVGAINGLKPPTEIEKSIIKNLVEEKIPPTPKTCKAAKITPHTIDVQGHAPIRQHPRRITKKLLKAAHDEVDRLIREDIVMESNSPWCSCPVIVPKKDVDRITRRCAIAIVTSASPTSHWTIVSIRPDVPPAISTTPDAVHHREGLRRRRRRRGRPASILSTLHTHTYTFHEPSRLDN
ncbi:unnamed protein product [Trichogramma brassicae]|uniref:Reverse transcriptase Ty1/copia-type domain-containing protein n=1 Tax=Trichogramma brassicae TaxID=86971 RepID=A0A6H5IPJ6_9HYME|nr:unnamed protein product [Trichogramma brassicae]